ncbi:propionyl-coenzyme A carboxylase alpha polypeptide [bacterium M00.F.Ca.ET.141.01.1.1]|nr:propionyl-coenzyme A carboxylase alpha polypeptide [bacterium M00.F.Ca.ET.141.01.1.1]
MHPPLACRPSPSQGERSDVIGAFANLLRRRKSAKTEAANLPPFEGEMSGRTEGGA